MQEGGFVGFTEKTEDDEVNLTEGPFLGAACGWYSAFDEIVSATNFVLVSERLLKTTKWVSVSNFQSSQEKSHECKNSCIFCIQHNCFFNLSIFVGWNCCFLLSLIIFFSDWIIHPDSCLISVILRKTERCSFLNLRLMISSVKKVLLIEVFQVFLDHLGIKVFSISFCWSFQCFISTL